MSVRAESIQREAAPAAPVRGLIQRTCACGRPVGASGECDQCRRRRLQGQPRPQASLRVGAPSDSWEREADQFAERMIAGTEGPSLRPTPVGASPPGLHLDHAQQTAVARATRGGDPLPAELATEFGRSLGHDFSQVRIRSDAEAATTADQLGARAFTLGRTVVFGAGEYAPATVPGRRLIAHELTHVAQQSAAPAGPTSGTVQRFAPDPENARRGGTLPHRQATQLIDCIDRLGPQSTQQCRHVVLGEPPPHPSHRRTAGISTPIPWEFEVDVGTSAWSGMVRGVAVRILPDGTTPDVRMRNSAKTSYRFTGGTVRWRHNEGRIESFTGGTGITMEIQTVYGRGASANQTSGYGRGTTAGDLAQGQTSLGFHEGNHGLDAMEYLARHPYPNFLGEVGMETGEFEALVREYDQARADYERALAENSLDVTDCVGTTIDQHNHQRDPSIITTECSGSP